MLKSNLDLLAKHHTRSSCDIPLLYTAVVFISLPPNSKCQTLDVSCRVQLLMVRKHVRRIFKHHKKVYLIKMGDVTSICSESNHSPLFSSGASSVLIPNIAFLKKCSVPFHFMSKHWALRESCVFDDHFPFSKLWNIPCLPEKDNHLTHEMLMSEMSRAIFTVRRGSLESQSRWRVVWGDKHLLSVWGKTLLLHSLLFTHS